jgi:hypothetical protein
MPAALKAPLALDDMAPLIVMVEYQNIRLDKLVNYARLPPAQYRDRLKITEDIGMTPQKKQQRIIRQ